MSIQDVKQKLTEISKGLSNVKSGLAELNTSQAPAVDYGGASLQSLLTGLSGNDITTKVQQTADNILNQKQEAVKTATTAKKSLIDTILNKKKSLEQEYNPTELRNQALTEAYSMWGLTPQTGKEISVLQGQLSGYGKQLADMEANKQMGLANIEQRLAGRPGDIVRGEKAIYEKQQNARIARVAAEAGVIAQELQAKMGLMKQAEDTTDKIVNALTYEYQQKVNDLNWAKETYSDIIDTWSKDEKDVFDAKIRQAEKELEQKRADHRLVLSLKLKYPNAGIDVVNDSVDEAYKKAAKQAGIEANKPSGWSLKQDPDTGQYFWVNPKTKQVEPVEFPQWFGVVEKNGKKTYLYFNSKQEAEKWSNLTGLPVSKAGTPTSTTTTTKTTTIKKPYRATNVGEAAASTPQAFVRGGAPTNERYILDLFGNK